MSAHKLSLTSLSIIFQILTGCRRQFICLACFFWKFKEIIELIPSALSSNTCGALFIPPVLSQSLRNRLKLVCVMLIGLWSQEQYPWVEEQHKLQSGSQEGSTNVVGMLEMG